MDKRLLTRLGWALTARYVMIHGMFWMAYAAIWAFAAVFLADKGFSSGATGLVTAAGSICSVALQPWLASLAERHEKFTVRRLGMACALTAAAGAALLRPAEGMAAVGILFLATAAVTASGSAILNTVGMEYVNMGIPVKYELARGCGSAAFAAGSVVYGWAAEKAGAETLMLFCLAENVLLFLFLAALPDRKKLAAQYALPEPAEGRAGEAGGFLAYLRENRRIGLLFAGIVLLFIGHNILNTYLINIVEYLGGGSAQMGAVNAVAAAVELPGMLLAGLLLAKAGGSRILRFAAVMFAVKSGLTLAAANLPMLVGAQLLQVSAYAVFTPVSVYYINAAVPPPYRVSGQAALGIAVLGLGASLGNLSGGLILDVSSVPVLLAFCTAVSAAGAVLLFAGTGEKESGKAKHR